MYIWGKNKSWFQDCYNSIYYFSQHEWAGNDRQKKRDELPFSVLPTGWRWAVCMSIQTEVGSASLKSGALPTGWRWAVCMSIQAEVGSASLKSSALPTGWRWAVCMCIQAEVGSASLKCSALPTDWGWAECRKNWTYNQRWALLLWNVALCQLYFSTFSYWGKIYLSESQRMNFRGSMQNPSAELN